MAENSASASASASPQKPLQSPPAGDPPMSSAAAPTPQNPSSTTFPQIPHSPSISDHSQISSPHIPHAQPHLDAAGAGAGALNYASRPPSTPMQQLQQQQQALMSPSSGFQTGQMQPGLQRPGSVSRVNQYGAAAGAVRMYAAAGGQMSFGGAHAAQQQQQIAAGMVGQVGQLPVMPGQSAAHYALQSQMISPPRQRGLLQGAQFNSANLGQTLQGIQAMGVMNTLSLNPQLRANGALLYGQQRIARGQMRPQQLSAQGALASSQKQAGQSLPRAPSMAPTNLQLSGLSQNGQSVQMTLAQQQQQQLLKQMQTSLPSSPSPSYHLQSPHQRPQQALLVQHLSSAQKSMGLTQQQISQLVQQQTQQSPRMPGPTNQISMTLSGPQPETPGSAANTAGGSQGAEADNQLLRKRKIQDLVSQVNPLCKFDPEVEDLLLEIADEFIDSVTTFACTLAKHRKSSVLEAKDVLLHLEKNWHLNIPGFSREEKNSQRSLTIDAQKKQMEMIRLLTESQQSGANSSGVRGTSKQAVNDAAGEHPIQPPSNLEQLSRHAVAPQMLQKLHRF